MSCPFSTLHRYFLGLVSNGNSYSERCGLQGRFGFAAFACDVGNEKPHPAIFDAACREAGCAPEELMHVGDSLRADVEGANAIGAVSVWLNRGRWPRSCQINPDLEVFTLTDFPSS